MNSKTKRITTCAIFSAIICVVTTFVAVPAPAIGNINLGDLFILCSAWLLGPYGAIASGVGACLADLLSGYAIYAPATFFIKLLMALCCHYIFTLLSKIVKHRFVPHLVSALLAECVMVVGYFLYECIIYGFLPAVASVPFNLIQGSICMVTGTFVISLLCKSSAIEGFRKSFANK